MKKVILLFIILLGTYVESYSQNVVQTYIDRCTGQVYVFTVPMNGQAVITFYNKSRTFTYEEAKNGTLQAWLEQTYQWWATLNPCSTNQATATTTQQTVQQTTQQATQAATNAVASVPAAPSVPTTPAAPTTSTAPPASNTTTTGGTNETTSTTNTTQSSQSSGDTNTETTGSTESKTNETTSETSDGGTGESTETKSEETTSDSSESNSEETSSDSSDSEDSGDSEEVSEESSEESSEEESSEESTEEEEEKKEEKKEQKKKNVAPPIIAANLMSMQMLDGTWSTAASFGVSQSSLTGQETYSANAMLWSNLKQYSITLSKSTVYFKFDRRVPIMLREPITNKMYEWGHYMDKGSIDFVFSESFSYMNMFGTHVVVGGFSNVFMGKPETFWQGFVGGTAVSGMVMVPKFGGPMSTVAFTAFGTKPFTVKNFERLSFSPMVAISATPAQVSYYEKKLTVGWNKYFTYIIGTNVNFGLTQRFAANLGVNTVNSSSPGIPTTFAVTIGARFAF